MRRISALFLTTAIAASVALPAMAQPPVPRAEVPGLSAPTIVQPVQATESYRVIELEETVRTLNGKVEELNFLLLQLQEKLRKMEEDNESRFQEIEEKQSSIGNDDNSSDNKVAEAVDADRLGKPLPSGDNLSPDATPNVEPSGKPARIITEARRIEPNSGSETESRTKPAPQPRALGTLIFDKSGNVIDTPPQPDNEPASNPFGNATAGAVEASEFGATPNEVLQAGKKALADRQYKRAQQALNAHTIAWPKDPQTGQVRYLLAEALFWQKQYYKSAELHLETHNKYPNASTAADNLLGLGLALAGLNQREVACATYAEVLQQYPDAKSRLAERVKDEQAAARC